MPQFIEADVIQKIATPAEWGTLLGTKIPYKGQIMLVSDSTGKVVNIKVGDGTNNFASLEYMFDTIQANVNYVPYTATPAVSNAFTIVGEGTYGSIVVPSGELGILFWDGTVWSLQDSVALPIQQGVPVINPVGSGLPTEKATADYVKPIYDITTKGDNLSDNSKIELGSYIAPDGNPQTTSNQKRLPPVLITYDMVGYNTISGYGIASTSTTRICINGPSGNTLYTSLGGGSSGSLAPITFQITEDMVGGVIKFSLGAVATEPEVGFKNTFMWNKGQTALPFSTYGLSIDVSRVKGAAKEYDTYTKSQTYNRVELDAKISAKADEVNSDGKVVRVDENKSPVIVTPTLFGNDSGYFNYLTGSLPSSLSGWKRALFPVDDDTKEYLFSGLVYSSSNVAGAVFFDSQMNYLGYDLRVYPTGNTTFDRRILTMPLGTAYIGTSSRNEGNYPVIEKNEGTGEYPQPIFDRDLLLFDDKVAKILGHDILANSERGFNRILAFGDSTTYGADLPNPQNDRWTTLLEDRINVPVDNYGFSGARAEEITFWQGGIQIEAQLSSNIIPGIGERISVSFSNINPFRASTVPSLDVYLKLYDGTLIEGNLSKTEGFMQTGSNPIDTVNGKVSFAALKLKDYVSSENIMIVSFGANNVSLINSGEQTVDDLMKWYSDFAKQHPKCLIWSQNIRNASELSVALPVEDFLEKNFGTRFCNMRKYLCSQRALDDATAVNPGFIPTSSDITAVSNNTIPPSFKFVAGSAHLNELGHKLQANFLYAHLKLYFS